LTSVGEVGINVDVGVEPIVWFDVVREATIWFEVVVEVELEVRRRTRRRAPRPVGGQTQVAQDLLCHAGVVDRRQDGHPALATSTAKNVDREHSAEQSGPVQSPLTQQARFVGHLAEHGYQSDRPHLESGG
jgi:hypothetical protein